MRSGFYNEGGSSTQNNFNNKNPFRSNKRSTLDFGTFNRKENEKAFSGFIKFAKSETKKYTKEGKQSFKDMFDTFREESSDAVDQFGDSLIRTIRESKRELESLSRSMSRIGDDRSRESKRRLDEYSRQYSEMVRRRINEERTASDRIRELRDRSQEDSSNTSRNNNIINSQSSNTQNNSSNNNNNGNNNNGDRSTRINNLKSVFSYAWNESSGPNNFFRNMSRAFDEFAENSESTGGTVASLIASSLSSVLDTFINKFFSRLGKGIDTISDTYNSTYHDIAVLTNTTHTDYTSFQDKTIEELKNQSLNNNVALSEVLKQYSEAVTSGITDANTAQSVALQDVITKKINPLINTQTDAYKDMQLSMGDKFVDTVNGISQSLNQEYGKNNRFMSKNFDNLLSEFQPVIMNAKQDYAVNNIAGLSEALAEAQANGATTEQLNQMKQDAYDLQYNRYNMLTSGNATDAMKAIAANEADPTGTDLTSALTASTDAMKSWTDKIMSSNSNLIVQQAGLGSSGLDYRTALLYNGLSDDTTNEMRNSASSAANKDYESLAKSATEKEANDDNTTQANMKDIAAENASNMFAKFKEFHPDAYDAITSIGGTVSSLAKFIIGGKLVTGAGSLLRNILGAGSSGSAGAGILSRIGGALGSAGSRLGSMASSAGGFVAEHATGIAGGAAIVSSIIDGVKGFFKSDEDFKEKNNGGKSSASQKVASIASSAVAGSGPGLFDEGSVLGKILNIGGNALKGAGAGAAIGASVGGVGAIPGAIAGAITGTITGSIGSKNIANAIDDAKDTLVEGAKTLGSGIGELASNTLKSLSGAKDKLAKGSKKLGSSIKSFASDVLDNLNSVPSFFSSKSKDKKKKKKPKNNLKITDTVPNYSTLSQSSSLLDTLNSDKDASSSESSKDNKTQKVESSSDAIKSMSKSVTDSIDQSISHSDKSSDNISEALSNMSTSNYSDVLSSIEENTRSISSLKDVIGNSDATSSTIAQSSKSVENIQNSASKELSRMSDSLKASSDNNTKLLKTTIKDSNNSLSKSMKDTDQMKQDAYNMMNQRYEELTDTTAKAVGESVMQRYQSSSMIPTLDRTYTNLSQATPTVKDNDASSLKDSSIEKAIKDSAQYIVKAIRTINETVVSLNNSKNQVVDRETGLVSPRKLPFSTTERDLSTVVPRSF